MSRNAVSRPPAAFDEWVRDNAERLERSEARGTLPYWVRDNRGRVDAALGSGADGTAAVAGVADQRPKGQEEAAGEERRAKREEEKVENRPSVIPPFVEKYVLHHDGKVLASPLHGADELEENLKLGKILSEAVDDTVYLLPNINPKGKDAHLRGSYLPPGVKDGKNPDFLCGGRLWDGKQASFKDSDKSRKSIKSILENHIKKAKQQAGNFAIEIPDWVKDEWVDEIVNNYLALSKENRWILIIRQNRTWKLYKTNKPDIMN